MKKRSVFSVILYLAVLSFLFSFILGMFSGSADDLTYSQIVELFRKEQVKSFVVQEQTIILQLHNPYNGKTELECPMADAESFRQELGALIQSQRESGILQSYDFVPQEPFSVFDLVWPLLIVLKFS